MKGEFTSNVNKSFSYSVGNLIMNYNDKYLSVRKREVGDSFGSSFVFQSLSLSEIEFVGVALIDFARAVKKEKSNGG